jgi:hypothetical protein
MDFIRTTDDLAAVIAALDIAARHYEADAVMTTGEKALLRRKASQARRLQRQAESLLKRQPDLAADIERRGYQQRDRDGVLIARWTSGREIYVSGREGTGPPRVNDWSVMVRTKIAGTLGIWRSGARGLSVADAIAKAENIPLHAGTPFSADNMPPKGTRVLVNYGEGEVLDYGGPHHFPGRVLVSLPSGRFWYLPEQCAPAPAREMADA